MRHIKKKYKLTLSKKNTTTVLANCHKLTFRHHDLVGDCVLYIFAGIRVVFSWAIGLQIAVTRN